MKPLRRLQTVSDGWTVLASIAKANLRGVCVPLIASWNVTFRCNCRCAYCASASLAGEELDTTAALTLLDDLTALGMRWVTFSGGEPLLRQDLGRLIGRAKGKGLYVRLSTNGILVPSRLDELRGLDMVSISLDGPEGVHDAVRGRGTFAKALNAFDACRGAGIAASAVCTLNQHNINSVDELLGIAGRAGVSIMFQPATTWINLGRQPNPVALQVQQYRRVMEHLIELKGHGAAITNSVKGLRYLARWPEASAIACFAGRVICSIQPDGGIVACALFEDACQGGTQQREAPLAERLAAVRRQKVHCNRCWCAPLVELNYVLSLSPGAIMNVLRIGR
ncbi:MAG: radical SAM protein [Planctomycetaceae bacterium]|nr:radical SAM protein [Planctomycetaceae bacterium]